ncbi:DJ-1/PfpI family protein [Crossiella sp. CA-258035]|uniref:DJ-1/PfpI family protein n=1 Tax=Crossiella sp. CA-258035 TaxID=2981138 RepID=UPI0024BC5C25|nr:DJ-1/PfpI family protein [Crossiella sp. CA-258035]WHT18738.1 DJ-1/PfpI family protein [Crossiella sp. CA-258035]
MRTKIGILLFDGVEELDAVGPWEVLASWAERHPEDQVEVFTMSPGGAGVRCAKGLRVLADRDSLAGPELDVLLYPGGRGARALRTDPEHLDWLRALRARVPLLTSVCSGSLSFAAAGLLTGRPATSHWSCVGQLTELDPTIEPRPEERFVDTGDVITSAGVSAGIDLALHLVARLSGVEVAREVRRYIQYDPMPPV